ncbi:ABC transporter, substrate-binding protein, aliphatic sulfonates family [Synechococcus sp. PCC 7335]|uniref:taurine ABC transporter substrate-binding protein n=1 Tax=Synechococcus sp. (strain ATCC 29403 / PCC 7335) TaxID=91464 RepID=UPI00017EB893|nr:aliphatic sulfonate ABC transporter substrate-binding protein [Synechococcus sp. PCC 7335]EDX87442.1 ABC transporter, substrate-binding protein, aliphatic sulfonates family [Synechococcus sp. PCC 7335]
MQQIRRFLNRRRFLSATTGLAVCSLVLTIGCSQNMDTATETEAASDGEVAAAPSSDMPKVKVGFQTGDINNITMVAAEEGYFEEVGLDVEMSPYSSGGAMVPALAAGEVDITWFFPFPSLTAFATGVDLEVVLLDHAPLTAERLIASESIPDMKALSGKTIGVTIGTSGHHSLLAALDQAGISQDDVTLVNLKPSEMAAAFSAKQIDAAWTWEPAAGKLNELGGTDIATAKSVGAYAVALWGVRKEFAEENPEVMQKFMEAWDLAQKDYLADTKAGQQWEAKRLNLTPEEFGAMVDRQGSTVIPIEDQLSDQWLGQPGEPESTDLYKAYEEYATFLVEQGRLDSVPEDLSPLINSSYIAEYLETK